MTTTINLNKTAAKMTRAQAMDYVLDNMGNAPAEVLDVLIKIRNSFTKKTKAEGPTKAQLENMELAKALGEYVNTHFNEDEPMAITAKVISDNVAGIATTQKVTAVVKYAEDVKRVKANGKVAYVPADVEIVTE